MKVKPYKIIGAAKMTVQTDKTNAPGKTKEEPSKMKDSSKTTFDPEQISPGDMIVHKGTTRSAKVEYEWARYIVLQKIVTTSRLRDEPRTAFKALLLSCHENNQPMHHRVGTTCLIGKYQFTTNDPRDWWETVVESGLSWEEGKDRKNVNNGEGR